MIADQTSPVSASAEPSPHAPPPARPERLMSLDAYRGFVMLLMISAGLNIPKVAANFKESPVWQFLAWQTDHAAWRGCTLWDLIQPSFMFIVGVALPYSLAARKAQGRSFGKLFAQALLALVAARRAWRVPRLDRAEDDELQLRDRPRADWIRLSDSVAARVDKTAHAVHRGSADSHRLLGGVRALPRRAGGVGLESRGRSANWSFFSGFEAHWQKNANFAAAFDQWFLNLFPQEKRFVFNAGGYQTLNFVPSLATMIIGLVAGGVLRSERSAGAKIRWLAGAGLVALAAGWLWDFSGLCPMVKRIWTPSFAIFSAGWALLLLALFFAVVDVRRHRGWAFFCVVAGMNSIALYCMSMLLKPWIRERLKLHLGQHIFEIFGATYAPMVEMTFILLVLWLIAFWMFRRKIFLRI
jgi:predicted acyltransferase